MKLKLLWLLLACSLIVACDDDGGDVEAGDTPTAGETPAGETPAGEDPAGEDPAGEDPAGEDPAGETPAGDTPAGDTPAGDTPAGDTPAGEPGGTMMSGICNEVVEVGATCDPDNDCCARGSFCNGEPGSGEGQCVRRCEIGEDGEGVGCEARELCLEAGEVGPDGITPGYCLPGDDCEPGNENLACGEGEFHCFRARNISLCIGDLTDIRAEAPELIVGEGEACDPFGDEENMINPTFCEPGFTCESNGTERVCRTACDADADCPMGQTCLDYTEAADGLNYKFCSPVCNLDNPDCGETGACVLTDIYEGVAFGTCQEVDPAQIVGEGERCDPTAQDTAPVYCAAGLSCEFDGAGSICRSVCTADADCAEGQTCFSAAERFDNDAFQYSFCTVPCDPLAQDCAVDTDVCVFSGVINDLPAGTCVSDVTAGTAANNEACTPGEEGFDYWGTCAANNICFIDDEEANTGTCGSFCTTDRADLCTGPYQACVDSNIEGLGLCQGFCNLEDNTGCDEGNSCMFLFNEGVAADGNPRAVGLCYENDNIGEAGLEEACIAGDLVFDGEVNFEGYWFLNNCEPNHVCIDPMDPQNNSNPICLKNCSITAQTGCPEGYTCQEFWRDLDQGVCFPGQ